MNTYFRLFYYKDPQQYLCIGVYVDDLLIIGSQECEILKFKKKMLDMFAMKNLGLLTSYLGIQLSQSEGEIQLSQKASALKILMVRPSFDHAKEMSKVNPTSSRSLMGSLR